MASENQSLIEKKITQAIIEINNNNKEYDVCKDVTIYSNFLTLSECKMFIDMFEPTDVVNDTDRITQKMYIDNKVLADVLWNRLEPNYTNMEVIDEYGEVWRAYALNSQFRICKYVSGGYYAKHEDRCYQDKVNLKSFSTFMMYLNTVDQELGGAMLFNDFNMRIQPKSRLGVSFVCADLSHCEELLLDGEKFILCTDVMYVLHCSKGWDLRQKIFDMEKQTDLPTTEVEAHCKKIIELQDELRSVCNKKESWEH